MNKGTSQPNVEGSPHDAVERVSVIIPAFNAESTVAETLDSLLAQTYPHWEALVVNDGSTDRTDAILAAYAERDERIVLLVGAGEGVSAARNRGIAAAQGRWFLFLDADDWIEPHHLETMIAALTAHPDAVAAYCRARSVSPQGRLSVDRSLAPVAARSFEMFSRSCHIAIHAVLLPRDVVLGLGGFDTSLRTCEDWDLWQRIARRGGRWVYVDEVLSYYRLRENSLSRNIPQLLEDAETVIRRGFGRDERVPDAAAEHLEGARPADLTADLVVAEVGLWYATLDRLEGGNGEAALSFLARQRQPPAPASILAETLLYATAEALQAAPETLAARWPDFGPVLTGLIADLGALWDDPVAARRLQYRLEKLILQRGDCSEPRTLALTMGLTLDPLDSRAVTLPAGIDRLYLRLVQGHWRGLDLELGVLGTVTRRQILQLLLECYGMKSALKAMPAGAWPVLIARFSLHAARAAIRGGRRMLRRSGFRALLLGAGRDAILGWVGSANGGHAAALEELRRELEARAAAAEDIRPPDKPTHGAQWARARLQVVWGGAVATRTEVRDERRNHVPVLMYHRIAEEGPDELAPYRVAPGLFREQMAWLRRHGYHALNAGEVGWFLRSRSAFAGRPVLLSFDDGYQDFADVAWPVLREHDFTAEVFVVTDLVGRTSEWDKELRAAFPLMDAETIARLHAEGAHFGSHLASHRAADGLSTRELAAELLRSRSMLWRWLGTPPQSIAAPFGLSDERLRRLAAECGYTVGFGTHPGAASFSSHLLELPRIEVRGEWTMKEFAAALEIHL